MYVPDQYKAQEMCYEVILENVGILKFVHERSKNV